MYTIHTSVFINAVEPHEQDHAASRQLLGLLRARQIKVIVPTLVTVEVDGTVSRLRDAARAQRLTEFLLRLRIVSFVSLDATLARQAAALAAVHRLRGADAVYAAVSQQFATTLVALARIRRGCRVEPPMTVLPPDLAALVDGATWERVTLGESGAQVYRLRAGTETRYLKVDPRRPNGELQAEAKRLHWLQGRLPVPALRYAGADESHSYMLTTEVPGVEASDDSLRAEPDRLIVLLAESLLLIHRQPIAGCPFDQCLDAELARAAASVAAGTVDIDDFDEERAGRSATSLLDELYATRPSDEDLVLTHGDYCFPNVVVNNWSLSGFIDLGRCGVADRYHDLAQAARSVRRNLGEHWVAPFFIAYGISEPDEGKLRYYQLLDEFF